MEFQHAEIQCSWLGFIFMLIYDKVLTLLCAVLSLHVALTDFYYFLTWIYSIADTDNFQRLDVKCFFSFLREFGTISRLFYMKLLWLLGKYGILNSIVSVIVLHCCALSG